MQTVSISIPDSILENHQHNLEHVRKEAHQGFIIWEYLNGHLSLEEAGQWLQIGYRGFLELLWSRGIPVDGLSDQDLQHQVQTLEALLQP